MLIVPHLAQEHWLKKGPKEHLQDEKLRGSYGVCFGLRFPPLSTEMTTACGFVCPLCTERRLYPQFAILYSPLVTSQMPGLHLVSLAGASLKCFSCFSEQWGRGRHHDGTDYWSTQSHVWPLEMEGKSVLKTSNPALWNREVLLSIIKTPFSIGGVCFWRPLSMYRNAVC